MVETVESVTWYTTAAFLRKHKGMIGRTAFYEGIRQNTIPHIRIGRKILVPSDALERVLQNTRQTEDAQV